MYSILFILALVTCAFDDTIKKKILPELNGNFSMLFSWSCIVSNKLSQAGREKMLHNLTSIWNLKIPQIPRNRKMLQGGNRGKKSQSVHYLG